MLQNFIERLGRAIERPGDETQAELAAFREREFFLEVWLAAERPGVSATQNSQTAGIRDRSRQTPARDERHRRREIGMANSELLGQPRFRNSRPFPKSWRRTSNRHDFRATWGQKKCRLGEGLYLLERGVGRELAEEQALGSDVNDRKLGDDVVYHFDACERERACFQDLGFVVARRVFHGDQHP